MLETALVTSILPSESPIVAFPLLVSVMRTVVPLTPTMAVGVRSRVRCIPRFMRPWSEPSFIES